MARRKQKDPSRKLWHILATVQDWICPYCGQTMTAIRDKPNSATVDHKHPKSEDGSTAVDNVCAACWRCNTRKGNIVDYVPPTEYRR